MENITIQVDPEIAKAYRDADADKKRKIQIFLNIMLKKAMTQKSLLEVMEEASQEAVSNGMTPEILESIINNEN